MLISKLYMGGYGYYIWSAYSMTLLVFGINLFLVVRENRQIKQLINYIMKKNRANES